MKYLIVADEAAALARSQAAWQSLSPPQGSETQYLWPWSRSNAGASCALTITSNEELLTIGEASAVLSSLPAEYLPGDNR